VSAQSWSTQLSRKQGAQTRQWQELYAAMPDAELTRWDRTRGWAGRHTQVNLRRAAYVALRARGRLTP